jgi:DNA-binding NarL/FixJ family response regulator
MNLQEIEMAAAQYAHLRWPYQQAAELAGQGYTIEKMAARLKRRADTVKVRLLKCYRTMGVKSIAQLSIVMYWKQLFEDKNPVLPAIPIAKIVSPRQLEVASLIADGCSNVEIGRALGITEATVKRHVTDLSNSLGFSRRVEIAQRVILERFWEFGQRASPTSH